MYIPVVTLSKKKDKKLLEQLKLGFERTVKWNKYHSHHSGPNIEIKDFNVLIDGKSFFDLPVKTEEEPYQKKYWGEKK